MQIGYTNNTTFKITFSGLMLGLVILFQYLEKFMPIMDIYMSINLSIVFIMATIYVTGMRWAFLLLILRFIIGPAIGSTGYSTIGIWDHFILLSVGLIFMNTFFVFHKYIFRFISNEKINLLSTSVVSIIITSLLGAFLNGVIFTPMYWHLMNFQDDASISAAKESYKWVYPIAFFGIPNYWAGMITAFGVGNLIKYSIASFAFIVLWKAVKHYEKK